MPLRIVRWRAGLAAFALACIGAPGASRAEDFPPITDTERALKTVGVEPNAPAVVLFHKGELKVLDPSRHESWSRFVVQGRIKILTDEGKSQGEIEIPHSDRVRLADFAGRTVLPDGRIVPLPKEAKFERRISKNRQLFVTAVAFPAVQVGAILDYRYELRFRSIFHLEPWYFASRLPILYSEIVYLLPPGLRVTTWSRDPVSVIKSERQETDHGLRFRAWAERLTSVPREPFGSPFEDLTPQIILVPTLFGHQALLSTWSTTSDLLLGDYDKARHRSRAATRRAEELVGSGDPGARSRAAALYRFVRDQIVTEPGGDVVLEEGSSVDDVLDRHRGDSLQKSLLLVAMLDAVKIEARPIWTADRRRGTIDLRLANPAWFDHVLVMATIDGKRTFLDPSDRALGFGQLPAGLEGTPAVLPDAWSAETLVLPEEPFDHNRRRAVLKLAIDDKGTLRGSGTLLLSGQPASERIGWKGEAEKTAAAWKEWLEQAQKGFAISDVSVSEAIEERRVEVRWAMAERAEEALGDEVTLLPSRPLGPVRQPLPVPAARRRSPVLLPYADRDEVELDLTWPAGWTVERRPQAVRLESEAGALMAEVTELEIQAAERTLTYRRRLDRSRKLFTTLQEIDRLRLLYDAAEKSDAEPLVLVRRAK